MKRLNALELLLTEVKTSKAQLEECERMLAEAQSEEDEVRSLLEGSGKTNAELNRALGDAIGALEEAKKAVAAAQSEVDRTAAQVEIIASSLGEAEEKFEESRLELEEKEAEFKAASGSGKKVDRSSLTQGIIDSENAESRLLEENAAIERRMTETERQLRSARAELESKSNSKGMAGGAAAVLGARDRGELRGVIGTIAELCGPINAEHETALATAFGGAMTSVVVDSDQVCSRRPFVGLLSVKQVGQPSFH